MGDMGCDMGTSTSVNISSFEPSAPPPPYFPHGAAAVEAPRKTKAARPATLPKVGSHEQGPKTKSESEGCCCCSLTIGCKLHASQFLVILGILLTIWVITEMVHGLRHTSYYERDPGFMIRAPYDPEGAAENMAFYVERIVEMVSIVVLLVATIAAAAGFLYGSRKNRRTYLLSYIIVLYVHIVLTVLAIVASMNAYLPLATTPVFLVYLTFLIWGVVSSHRLRASKMVPSRAV